LAPYGGHVGFGLVQRHLELLHNRVVRSATLGPTQGGLATSLDLPFSVFLESRQQAPAGDDVRMLLGVIAQVLVDLALQRVDPAVELRHGDFRGIFRIGGKRGGTSFHLFFQLLRMPSRVCSATRSSNLASLIWSLIMPIPETKSLPVVGNNPMYLSLNAFTRASASFSFWS
jgi:hypothetical protein